MRLYVGNISYGTDEEKLKEAFGRFGDVSEARVITDRDTGRSKGFAFVEMPNDAEAEQAVRDMDGTELEGRMLKVNEAMPQERRGPRY